MILEAGEHQKPLKGGEEKQSTDSGQYHYESMEEGNECLYSGLK